MRVSLAHCSNSTHNRNYSGALFLNCTWILYEYGSVKGYGETEENAQINHVFEAVMAVAIMTNIFLALNGMSLWVLSVLHSGSNQQWVFTVRNMLSLCQNLVTTTVLLDFVGMVIAVYSNLSPRWPETIICFVVAAVAHILATGLGRDLGDIGSAGVLPYSAGESARDQPSICSDEERETEAAKGCKG